MLRSVGLQCAMIIPLFFFSSRRRHTSCSRDWSSDVCSSDLILLLSAGILACQQGLSTEPPLPPGTRVGWYVTVNGTSSGAGTTGSPWNLQTALGGGNGKVQAGDTIWLRRGTYAGTFYSGLSGTAASPIVVRAYPGERAA